MAPTFSGSQQHAFQRRLIKKVAERYFLRLFITGATPRSLRAIEMIKKVCEEHLPGRYHLQVVDVYQQPDLARKEQIVAAPTLIKYLPLPIHRLIGDMSNVDKVLAGLDLTSPDLTKQLYDQSSGT